MYRNNRYLSLFPISTRTIALVVSRSHTHILTLSLARSLRTRSRFFFLSVYII